jgi:outer membrane protein OmpA-like peptidoglycan-associated protein
MFQRKILILAAVVGLGAGLLAACDGPNMASAGGPMTCDTSSSMSGAPVVTAPAAGPEVSAPSVSYRRPGPCWDGTDVTDRRNRDTVANVTRNTPDSVADVTDRRLRDDTTDHSVWCAAEQRMITAPSFMVFFDWDKSELSAQALAVIQQAADAYHAKGGAKITANGHTDTSGPPAYNQALSLRRANTVKAALIRDGVPENDISVVGYGETQLLVQTPDGVREAQNRRVEIVLK